MGEEGTLDFSWTATFSDGNVIEQFDKDGEHLFKEVEDNIAKLEEFSIVSKDGDELYIVDLTSNMIIGPDVSYTLTGSKPELIYKRRNDVRVEVGTGKRLDPRVRHIIGLKTTKEEQELEVFYGLGMRPKKVELINKKTNAKYDLTDVVSAKVMQIKEEKEK